MNIILSAAHFYVHLICAEAAFLVHVPRKNNFLLRLLITLSCLTGAVFGIAALFSLIPWFYNALDSFFAILFFMIVVALSLCSIAVCFKLPFSGILFVGVGGYSIEHVGNGFRSIMNYLIRLGGNDVPVFVDEFIIKQLPFFLVIAISYFVLIRPAVNKGELQTGNKGVVIVSFVNLLVCIVLSIFNGYGMGEPINQFVSSVICKIYAILSCVLCLCLQAGLFRQKRMNKDIEMLEQLFHVEREQHQVAKETIDLINIKCHDLRHQLKNLDSLKTEEERQESIAGISDAILIYDAIAKTGNDALDVILMEKSLICDKHKIKFSYIVDGTNLGYLRTSDMYPLFGNMIENAIESVMRENDEDRRIVSLNIRNENDMLFIHMDNYCHREIRFEDGLPVTTKDNKDYHGYGVKGIRYIVNKYNGELRMYVQDDRFNVDIMIPLEYKHESKKAV